MQDGTIPMKWDLAIRRKCTHILTLWVCNFTCKYLSERGKEKEREWEKEEKRQEKKYYWRWFADQIGNEKDFLQEIWWWGKREKAVALGVRERQSVDNENMW